MKKEHRISEDHLQAYFDGHLSEPEKILTEKHLSGCTECQAYILQLEKLDRAITNAECRPGHEPYFETFASRVANGIAQRKIDQGRNPEFNIFRWVGIPLAATVTLAIALIVSLSMFSKDEKPSHYSLDKEKRIVADKDEYAPFSESGLKKSKMAPAEVVEKKVMASTPHMIKEVTTIVIYLPGEGRQTCSPEISKAIQIDLPNGG